MERYKEIGEAARALRGSSISLSAEQMASLCDEILALAEQSNQVALKALQDLLSHQQEALSSYFGQILSEKQRAA